jgi:peroxiredoxin
MAFYAQLGKRGARVVGVTTESIEANRAFWAAGGAVPTAILSARESGLSISATPTVIVVNRQGVVLGAWVGKLDEKAQKEVIATIAS